MYLRLNFDVRQYCSSRHHDFCSRRGTLLTRTNQYMQLSSTKLKHKMRMNSLLWPRRIWDRFSLHGLTYTRKMCTHSK